MKELTYFLLVACTIISILIGVVAYRQREDSKIIAEIAEVQIKMGDKLMQMERIVCELIDDHSYLFVVPCSKSCKEAGIKK